MNGVKRTLTYLHPYRRQAILAPTFKLLEALMDLVTPLIVAQIINQGIAKDNFSLVVRCFLLLLLLAASGMGFSFTAQWFAARASVGCTTGLRQALFDHIENLSYTELDTMGTDTLITRMTSDMNQVQNGLNLVLRLLLRSPFIVVGAVILSFTVNVKAALVFVVTVPVLSVVIFGIMAASIPLYAKTQGALDRLLGTTRENLTGVRVIRAFHHEKDEVEEFDRENQALTKINEFVGRLSALMNPATFAIVNIATILLIRVGAVQVNHGNMAQGDVVALYNYMAQIIIELIKLASLIININRSIACADRINKVLSVESSMQYPYPKKETERKKDTIGDQTEDHDADGQRMAEKENAVVFDHVSFAYAGTGEDALSHINFTVKKGQTIGVIGGTGSGKSTLVNLIPRFYDVSKGKVLVQGQDVRDYPKGQLIQKIGMVPQKAVLFEGSIRDNLLWGNENASEEDLWKAIETAQALEVVQGKEGGLDAFVEQNGRNLSGGQRQRLTIARALVRKPSILIMDDSSSALDFATDLSLRKAIHGLEGEMTVFIVSQRTSSARSADQIIVLNDGQMVGLGSHDELMKNCRVYQEIYYSQFPDEKPADWKEAE
jgi:ATP-binding cassette subfamily B multidrug efflux pump